MGEHDNDDDQQQNRTWYTHTNAMETVAPSTSSPPRTDLRTAPPPIAPRAATPALVVGANSEQGRAVVEGLVDAGYSPVYALIPPPPPAAVDHDGAPPPTPLPPKDGDRSGGCYLRDGLGATVLYGDLQNPHDVTAALTEAAAPAIFVVTSTALPSEIGQTSGFAEAAEDECLTIVLFFQLLVEVYLKDLIPRHVVLSVCDNVQACNYQELEDSGDLWISPLEDGSVVPHFTAKGKGGAFAVDIVAPFPDLKLTLLTVPFLYSNFLGFFAPLRDETATQWMLTACFGDGANAIDMMSASDLAKIVRT